MMDPELMAALGGGGSPMGAAPMGAPVGPPMPSMGAPMAPMGGTPADAALPVLLMLQQQQAQEQAALEEEQKASMMSMLAQAVGSIPNPMGAAAMSEGALPPVPDQLGAPVDPSMAMSGGV